MPTAKSLPAKLGFLRAEGLHATNNPQNPSPPTAEYGIQDQVSAIVGTKKNGSSHPAARAAKLVI
jgi:hypothetical protein